MCFPLSIPGLTKKAKARPSRAQGEAEPENSEVGRGRVGPTNSRPQPTPHLQIVEDSGDVDPRVGESDSTQAS